MNHNFISRAKVILFAEVYHGLYRSKQDAFKAELEADYLEANKLYAEKVHQIYRPDNGLSEEELQAEEVKLEEARKALRSRHQIHGIVAQHSMIQPTDIHMHHWAEAVRRIIQYAHGKMSSKQLVVSTTELSGELASQQAALLAEELVP